MTTTKEIIGKKLAPESNFQYATNDVTLNSYELGIIVSVITEKSVAQITIDCFSGSDEERWHPDVLTFFQAVNAARKIHEGKLVQDEDGTPFCKECGEQHGLDLRGEPGQWEWSDRLWQVYQHGEFYEIDGHSSSIILHADHIKKLDEAGKRMGQDPEVDYLFECPEHSKPCINSVNSPTVGDAIEDEIKKNIFRSEREHEETFHRADKLRGWIKHQKKRAEEFEVEGDTRGLKICKKLIGNFEKELKEIEG